MANSHCKQNHIVSGTPKVCNLCITKANQGGTREVTVAEHHPTTRHIKWAGQIMPGPSKA